MNRLVEAEFRGRKRKLFFKCSHPKAWRFKGPNRAWVHGWWVDVTVSKRLRAGRAIAEKRAYLIQRRPGGFAIVADGKIYGNRKNYTWHCRNLRRIDDHLARGPKPRVIVRPRPKPPVVVVKPRRKPPVVVVKPRPRPPRPRSKWAAPTAQEFACGNFGRRPKHYQKTVRDYLCDRFSDFKNVKVKCFRPAKTWGRYKGSNETVYGWKVEAQVTYKKKGKRGQRRIRKNYHFMFKGEEILATTRQGTGFRLSVASPGR